MNLPLPTPPRISLPASFLPPDGAPESPAPIWPAPGARCTSGEAPPVKGCACENCAQAAFVSANLPDEEGYARNKIVEAVCSRDLPSLASVLVSYYGFSEEKAKARAQTLIREREEGETALSLADLLPGRRHFPSPIFFRF